MVVWWNDWSTGIMVVIYFKVDHLSNKLNVSVSFIHLLTILPIPMDESLAIQLEPLLHSFVTAAGVAVPGDER